MMLRMAIIGRCLLVGFVMGSVLSSQSLHVAPSATDGKTPGLFAVLIDSPAGKAPVALQWEFSIPAAIAVKTSDISIGKAAESAKKSITCAGKPATEEAAHYTCILAGGQAAIGNGAIAVVGYQSKVDVHGAPVRVAIENVVGVSVEMKQISLPNAAAIITIRK